MLPVDERPGECGRCWHFDLTVQWHEWLTRGWNWRNFTVIALEIEVSEYKGDGTAELTLGLLGFVLVIETYRAESRAEALGPVHRIRAALERGEVVATTLEELGARDWAARPTPEERR